MLRSSARHQFDHILDQLVAELPDHLRQLLEEVPLIVEDEPSSRLMDELHLDRSHSDLCGLHWGVPLTERSVQHSGTFPDRMMLFRGPIIRLAARQQGAADEPALHQQIRITLLHEIGHHFGLDEDDLTALGYG